MRLPQVGSRQPSTLRTGGCQEWRAGEWDDWAHWSEDCYVQRQSCSRRRICQNRRGRPLGWSASPLGRRVSSFYSLLQLRQSFSGFLFADKVPWGGDRHGETLLRSLLLPRL